MVNFIFFGRKYLLEIRKYLLYNVTRKKAAYGRFFLGPAGALLDFA